MFKNFEYYPSLYDKDLIEKIYKKKEYYINKVPYPDENLTMDDICMKRGNQESNEIKLLPFQKFAKNFINPNTPFMRVLLFLGVGAGKTLSAVNIGEGFKETIEKYRLQGDSNPFIYVISSDAARNNFIKELITKTGNYATDSEISKLDILKRSNDPIKKDQLDHFEKDLFLRLTDPNRGGYYRFLGYQKFTNMTIGSKIRGKKKRFVRKGEIINNLDNCVLIIDEAHQLNNNDWGIAVHTMIHKSKNLRVILLTATPMSNNPREIIRLLNLLLPKTEQIKRSNVFKDKYTLAKNGLDIIAEKSRGVVSFLRGINPVSFPERIDVGEIIKPTDVPERKNFKYTKLIRCVMSKLHHDTYTKSLTTSKKVHEMKRLVDMVLPNPNDPKTGIYKTNDIINYQRTDANWLRDHGIEVIQLDKNRMTISGDIFKMENIKKYSTKYYMVLQNLVKSLNPNSGPIFIYNENIQGIGLNLFEEILKMNGIAKYNELGGTKNIRCVYCGKYESDHENNKLGHAFIPATFITLEGDLEVNARNKLVSTLNNPNNRYGEHIKILLGSSVAKESIDFKFIREIHILNIQWNISTIEQIIGRGVRHCSHYLLEPERRNVRIFKYVSSLPGKGDNYKISLEENAYLKAEKTHITIKKIERVLKINAIDCALNKYGNVFIKEIEKYKNCDKKGEIPCDLICDYTDCNYKCYYEPGYQNTPKNKKSIFPKYKELTLDELNQDTYDINFFYDEVIFIKEIIKELFVTDVIWSLNQIIDKIKENPESQLVDIKYIYLALDELITNKEVIIDSNGNGGYIIYSSEYYLFQPFNKSENITIEERRIPHDTFKIQTVNIQNYIDLKAETLKKPSFNKDIFIAKIIKSRNMGQIARIVNKLDFDQQIGVLEEVIVDHNEKNNAYSPIFINKIFKHFKSVLVTDKQIKSNSLSSKFFTTDITSDMTQEIIGHYLMRDIRCYIKGNWQKCFFKITKSEIEKYKENDIIIGFTSKDKNGAVSFKLREIEKESQKDKRKKFRGFTCNESSNKNKLIKVLKKLDVPIEKVKGKNSISNICKAIQMELIRRQNESFEKGQKIRWYYNFWELGA